MKALTPFAVLCSIGCLLILGCSDPHSIDANELYTEASKAFDLSKEDNVKYSNVFDSYIKAKTAVYRILSDYPSSNVALELSSGDRLLSGFTLIQFRDLEVTLEELAEAERHPLSCALLVAKTIEDKSQRIRLMALIAGKYAEAGETEQALQLLAKTHEIARTNTWPDFSLLCAIADKYEALGNHEQASRILSDATFKAQRATRVYDGVELNALVALPEIAVQFAAIGNFNQALQTANKAQEHDKAKAFAEIAGVYIQNGQKRQAEQLLSKAFDAAQTKISANQKITALVTIAGNYAEINQPEKASQVMMHAMEALGRNRSQTLAKIAVKHAEWGQIDQALKLSERVENTKRVLNSRDKSRVLAFIAVRYAELGDLQKALSLFRNIDELGASEKCITLAGIGRASALAGEEEQAAQLLTEAIEIARSIRYTKDKAEAYLRISGEYVKTGRLGQAKQLLSEAHQMVDTESLKRTFPHAKAEFSLFAEMASMYRELGQAELSTELLTEALQAATKIKRGKDKPWALLILAGGYAEVGQKEKSTQLLSQALSAATTFDDEMLGHQILGALAANYAKAGDLEQALKMARDIESQVHTKAQALAIISTIYTELGQEEQAAQLLAEALESAKSARNPLWKSKALVHISDFYKKSGQETQATELLSEALQAAVEERDSWDKTSVLFDITVKYAKLQNFSEALETAKRLEDPNSGFRALSRIAVEYAKAGDFDRGLETAATIEATFWRCQAWIDIAGTYIDAKEEKKASMLLAQALEATAAMEDRAQKSGILIDLADTFTALGQEADALQLLSEALETEMISSWNFESIVAVYKKIGRNDKASHFLTEAHKTIMLQEDVILQSMDLSFLADSCAQSGNLDEALATAKLFDKIEPEAGNAIDPGDAAFAWTSIAEKVAELSEEDTEILRMVTHAVMPVSQLSTYVDRLN